MNGKTQSVPSATERPFFSTAQWSTLSWQAARRSSFGLALFYLIGRSCSKKMSAIRPSSFKKIVIRPDSYSWVTASPYWTTRHFLPIKSLIVVGTDANELGQGTIGSSPRPFDHGQGIQRSSLMLASIFPAPCRSSDASSSDTETPTHGSSGVGQSPSSKVARLNIISKAGRLALVNHCALPRSTRIPPQPEHT